MSRYAVPGRELPHMPLSARCIASPTSPTEAQRPVGVSGALSAVNRAS